MRDYEDLVKSLRYCAEYDCTTVCPRAGTGNGCITRLKKEAADAIEELSKPRWIPVTERLPEDEQEVLVARHFLSNNQLKKNAITESFYVEVASRIGDDWTSYSDEYKIKRHLHKVIAWMPLPPPPEGES